MRLWAPLHCNWNPWLGWYIGCIGRDQTNRCVVKPKLETKRGLKTPMETASGFSLSVDMSLWELSQYSSVFHRVKQKSESGHPSTSLTWRDRNKLNLPKITRPSVTCALCGTAVSGKTTLFTLEPVCSRSWLIRGVSPSSGTASFFQRQEAGCCRASRMNLFLGNKGRIASGDDGHDVTRLNRLHRHNNWHTPSLLNVLLSEVLEHIRGSDDTTDWQYLH